MRHIGSVALVLAMTIAAAGNALAKDWNGKRVAVLAPPHAQLSERRDAVPLGASITAGGAAFRVEVMAAGLKVETTPGGSMISVASGKTASLRTKADARPIEVRFEKDSGGSWTAYAATGVQFDISGVPVRLLDLDLDGRVDGVGKDAVYLRDSTVAFPYAPKFIAGWNRLEIESVEQDGSVLNGDIETIDGTKQQLETLEAINNLRTQNGLVPVDLDAKLCERCTSHAEYLHTNGWTGSSNPHSQSLGPNGASAEGEIAAQRSIIASGGPLPALTGFWQTYYHRYRLMSPLLTKIGVNATPTDIAVIEDGEGAELDRPQKGAGNASTIPADGAIGVPTNSCGEKPKEPCPDLASRGFPILFLFCAPDTKITEFAATLTRGEGKKSVVEDVFIKQDDMGPILCGVIPKKPLAAKSAYAVHATYKLNGKPVDRTIRFKTQ